MLSDLQACRTSSMGGNRAFFSEPSLGRRLPHLVPQRSARRRHSKEIKICSYRETEESTASAGRDRQSALDWTHVANELKEHVAAVVGGDQKKMHGLQSWLQETKVAPAGESDTEHNQTEVLAVLAGDVVGLDALPTLNVQSWLSSPDTGPDVDPFFDDVDSRAAAVLVLRLLQAYQQETGQEFDDEDNACFEELDAIASQALKGSVDRDLLRRLVRAYITLPFGGLV